MADITYNGVIPNKGVNLTCIGTTVLSVNDWVEVTAAYEVDLPTSRGSYSIIGYVIVANSVAGEDVTVATRGNSVETFVAADTIAAGDPVVINTSGEVSAYDPSASPGSADTCCMIIGVALTAAVVTGSLDVLVF
jgi:hypothetical protein